MPNPVSPRGRHLSSRLLAEANVRLAAGRSAEAETLLQAIVQSESDNVEARDSLARLFILTGRPQIAAQELKSALAFAPDIAVLHSNLGYALTLTAHYEPALAAYDRAIALQPDFVDALYSRAIVLTELKRWNDAIASFDQAIALRPAHAASHVGRGAALHEMGRFSEALACYDRSSAIDPGNAHAHYNRGNVLGALERHGDALESYDKAIAIAPAIPEFHNNHGIVLNALKRPDQALASFDRALVLAPASSQFLTNRGNALNELKRHDEALACHDEAIRREPDYAQAHINRALALFDLRRFDEAIASYDSAIEIAPGIADAHYGRAIALNQLKRYEEALLSYECAHALNPALPFLLGKLMHVKASLCDWSNWDTDLAELARMVERGEKASPPFPLLGLFDRPDLHRTAAETYARNISPSLGAALAPRRQHDRIRLGYFSADFHDHATAVLMAELFERHERSRFELVAFSFGPETGDPMRKRLRQAFDRFIDVRLRSDREVAQLSRELEIDIAVDLKGYTGEARPEIFAHRAAPLQVNYLGYPGTLGARQYDYLIGDRTLVPTESRKFFSEKIAYLPHSYQPNDSRRPIASDTISRADAGLPEPGFVFCCFNNLYKITPEVFDRWMRILAKVEGSVLWLLKENGTAERNLRKQAAGRGFAQERLIFAPRIPLPEHLARHQLADLFLDTLPYNAHTTASDALWAGLPVLTLAGSGFAGRVAASLLNAIGLPELVTNSPEEYMDLAIALATRGDRLAALERKLAANRTTQPLFDIARFTKDIERVYVAMYERNQACRPPDHILLSG